MNKMGSIAMGVSPWNGLMVKVEPTLQGSNEASALASSMNSPYM
jgi:hypothetical protein